MALGAFFIPSAGAHCVKFSGCQESMDAHLQNALVILPLEPHSGGNGSQRRAAAHLSALLGRRNVHLVIFDSGNGSLMAGEQSLLSRCQTVSVLRYRWRPRRMISRLPPFSILSELLDPTVGRRIPDQNELRVAFAHVLNVRLDSVLCFKLISATIFDQAQRILGLTAARKLIDFDDIQSIVDQRSTAYEKLGLEQSIIEGLVRRQIRQAEDRCLANYDSVWICSQTDKKKLESRRPRARIDVIPNGVALEDYAPPPADPSEFRLLFVGTMSYPPNTDGIIWFSREILPIIRASSSIPVNLTIVGFNPPPEVKALEALGQVFVTGGVESVRPFYNRCDLVVAPVRFGGGTRIKILEAMSFRRPVVSTTVGAEGIEVNPGADILIADAPESFARECIDLIKSSTKRAQLATQGRKIIEARYSCDAVAEATKLVLERFSAAKR